MAKWLGEEIEHAFVLGVVHWQFVLNLKQIVSWFSLP